MEPLSSGHLRDETIRGVSSFQGLIYTKEVTLRLYKVSNTEMSSIQGSRIEGFHCNYVVGAPDLLARVSE